jgi:hypothetical protein
MGMMATSCSPAIFRPVPGARWATLLPDGSPEIGGAWSPPTARFASIAYDPGDRDRAGARCCGAADCPRDLRPGELVVRFSEAIWPALGIMPPGVSFNTPTRTRCSNSIRVRRPCRAVGALTSTASAIWFDLSIHRKRDASGERCALMDAGAFQDDGGNSNASATLPSSFRPPESAMST